MKVVSTPALVRMGYKNYSNDKRRRRRQHRLMAEALMAGGTFLNRARAPRGSIPNEVAAWHLYQARWLGR